MCRTTILVTSKHTRNQPPAGPRTIADSVDTTYTADKARLRAQRSRTVYATSEACCEDAAEEWAGHAAKSAEAARAAARSAGDVKDDAYWKAVEKVKVASQKVEATRKMMIEGEPRDPVFRPFIQNPLLVASLPPLIMALPCFCFRHNQLGPLPYASLTHTTYL